MQKFEKNNPGVPVRAKIMRRQIWNSNFSAHYNNFPNADKFKQYSHFLTIHSEMQCKPRMKITTTIIIIMILYQFNISGILLGKFKFGLRFLNTEIFWYRLTCEVKNLVLLEW